MPYSHTSYFIGRSVIDIDDIEHGDIIRFNYRDSKGDLSLRDVLVLYPDDDGLLHALDLNHLTPLELVQVAESLSEEAETQEEFQESYPIVEVTTNEQAYEDWYDDRFSLFQFSERPYRTFKREAMYNIAELTYETDIQA